MTHAPIVQIRMPQRGHNESLPSTEGFLVFGWTVLGNLLPLWREKLNRSNLGTVKGQQRDSLAGCPLKDGTEPCCGLLRKDQ